MSAINYDELYPHPNLNAEIYRNMTPGDRPPVSDKQLQFIAIYDDKTAVLGASSMTNRYWSGTVWLFNDCSTLEKNNASATSKTETGVVDVGFLASDRFVVGEDSGVLQILEVPKDANAWKPELECSRYTCQHDNSLTSIAIFDNKLNFVSAGMDCCIKVWDANEFIAERSYTNAHTDIVTSVDTKPKSESEFASTSLDCETVLWDIRQSRPAQCIYKKDICSVTSVAFNPSNDFYLAVGAADGSITLLDIRQPNNVIQESIVFRRPLHKLKFHPKQKNWLAGCSDDTVVKVVDSMNFSVVYEDTRHSDFVRGLAWYKDELLTCSWDDTILRHKIQSTEQ